MKSYKYQRAEQGVAVYAPQAARPQNADVGRRMDEQYF